MKPWSTRVLIFAVIAAQALSALVGSQRVVVSECGNHHGHESESVCDLTGCLAPSGHDDEAPVALRGLDHRCHCEHYHLRGESPRFERGRPGELLRKHECQPAALPPSGEPDGLAWTHAIASRPASAVWPPPGRLVAILSVRILV